MKYGIFALLFVVAAIGTSVSGARADDADTRTLQLERITPAGDNISEGREIVFQFSEAMVALGKMDRSSGDIPVAIEPALACQWRWITTSALACRLSETQSFQPATTYRITVSEDLKSLGGRSLAAPVLHSFTTVLPGVSNARFVRWKTPGEPRLAVRTNMTVEREKLEEHLFILSATGERYGVNLHPAKKLGKDWYIVWPEGTLPGGGTFDLKVDAGLPSPVGTEKSRETDSVLQFYTVPDFEFLGVRCSEESRIAASGYKEPVLVTTEGFRCDPTSTVALVFSAPVTTDTAKEGLTLSPNPLIADSAEKPRTVWDLAYSYSELNSPYSPDKTYSIMLPSPLRAETKYTLAAVAAQVRDEFGRTLKTDVSKSFLTGSRPPSLELPNRLSVLESGIDSHVPVFPTNLDSLGINYSVYDSQGLRSGLQKEDPLYDVKNLAYRYPLKVRELLEGASGAVSGTLSGQFRGTPWFFSQVTPFNVHLKLGHFNSLVWVSRFDTGEPVPDARVTFLRGTIAPLSLGSALGGDSKTTNDGTVVLEGLRTIDPSLDLLEKWREGDERIFLKVEHGKDVALLPVMYDLHSFSSGTYSYSRPEYGHLKAWGTTAQGVYRAGDMVQYKIYLRNQNNAGFLLPPKDGYTLQIIDPMDKVVAERKSLKLSDFGAIDGEFEAPKTGAVGWYRFKLSASFTKETWEPLTVLVSDFTPAPFRVETLIRGDHFQPGDGISVEVSAKLHAGGPWSGASTRLTATVTAAAFEPADKAFKDFEVTILDPDQYSSDQQIFQGDEELDSRGELRSTITVPDLSVLFGNLSIEGAVRDDRGKYVAASGRAHVAARDRYVGIRQSEWVLEKGKDAAVDLMVFDQAGRAQAGASIDVVFEQLETKAARVLGPGNAYLTQYTTEWIKIGSCDRESALQPVTCRIAPQSPGTFRATATVIDSKKRTQSTTISRWVIGSGDMLWEGSNDTALEIVPESDNYGIGDKARFLIKNPFANAQALISLERYGILKSWTTTLKQNSDILEVPITEDLIPGFYLSVTLLSPRVDKPLEGEVLDLGKPTFRSGYASVSVRDRAKELVVTAKADREKFKPRETVTVQLTAAPRSGKAEPVEYAVAVLDEAVFDLISQGSDYFDPYKGFYKLDALDVRNYNLLTQLIGRQKFEKKGANPGGDGNGSFDFRSLIKFVSYWNPALKADAQGGATFSFPVPDNLTGWRILALAVTPKEKFGLGQGTFAVNKPIEVRSALPNLARSGDSFVARFTVMNRMPDVRDLAISLHAKGSALSGEITRSESVSIAPYERATFELPVATTREGEVVFSVSASHGSESDGLVSTLPVRNDTRPEVVASYGMLEGGKAQVPVSIPEDLNPELSRAGVILSPSLIGNVDGAFAYVKDYPYMCWEQRLTKALMAAFSIRLQKYFGKALEWPEAQALVNDTLAAAKNFQTASGAMAFYIPEDQYQNPYLSAFTALGFQWLRELGYQPPQDVEAQLSAYLLQLVRKDSFPEFYSKGMASTVRAVALAALSSQGKVQAAELARHAQAEPQMDLFGKSFFLQAILKAEGSGERSKKVLNAIMARADETSGKISFNDQVEAGYERILATPNRSQCAVLSTLISAARSDSRGIKNLPMKLVRSIVESREKKDHWANTQENLFCVKALIDYAAQYESGSSKSTFEVTFGGAELAKGSFSKPTDEALEYDRVLGKDLIGKETSFQFSQKPESSLYYTARLFMTPRVPDRRSMDAGIEVRRQHSVQRQGAWTVLEEPLRVKRGELVRVDLYLSLPTARNFVVLEDPVAAGIEPVNRQLKTSSSVDDQQADLPLSGGAFWYSHDDWKGFGENTWSFYHRELRNDSVRFYSEYLPPGNYHLSYVGQVIAPGTFEIPAAHAEEMYHPDTFGRAGATQLQVHE